MKESKVVYTFVKTRIEFCKLLRLVKYTRYTLSRKKLFKHIKYFRSGCFPKATIKTLFFFLFRKYIKVSYRDLIPTD